MRNLFLLCGGLGLSIAFGAWACSDDTGTSAPDYTTLLQSLTNDVALPEHKTFSTSADALAASLKDLSAGADVAKLTKAQADWRAARLAWRHLDALHFGPVADLGITERIDLAPARATEIDPIVAGSTPLDASVVAKAGGHAKGFLGVEYLIFSSKGNDAVVQSLQDARKRQLASLMGDEIASSAHQLEDAWAAPGTGYAALITTAGKNARYPSQRAALDDMVGGIAYAFELVVGVRLAAPLGRKTGGTPDASQDPTLASDSAQADVKGTLEGISSLYNGQEISSRVRTKSTVLDDRIVSQIGDCGSKMASIPAPFGGSVTGATASVQAAYDACKAAKATWNADVTSALGATLKPMDNDGD